MSAEEFADWQGYLRRHPRGFHWDNWVQASIVREIHKSLEHRKGYRIPWPEGLPLPATHTAIRYPRARCRGEEAKEEE
jgi:hypothetical protein